MPADELQRLRVDERAQHRLHRIRDELAHRLRREAAKDDKAVLGSPAHGFVARPAKDEEELPGSRLRELPAGDQPTLVERSCERECRRAAQQRSVEVEERRRLCHVRRPAAASASSRRG